MILEDVTNEEILTINNFIFLYWVLPVVEVPVCMLELWAIKSYFVHIKVAYQLSFLDMLLVMSMKTITLIGMIQELTIILRGGVK